jgi:hypothetical protein
MSEKQKKFAWIVAGVLAVSFLGDWLGFWEMTAWIPTGDGPEGGQ